MTAVWCRLTHGAWRTSDGPRCRWCSKVRVRTMTRFSLLIETDDPALRAQIDEIANLPAIERDEMIAELMGWESRRILRNVGHARGRESAFAHNRRGRR